MDRWNWISEGEPHHRMMEYWLVVELHKCKMAMFSLQWDLLATEKSSIHYVLIDYSAQIKY